MAYLIYWTLETMRDLIDLLMTLRLSLPINRRQMRRMSAMGMSGPGGLRLDGIGSPFPALGRGRQT